MLAKLLSVEGPTVVATVDRLVGAGLIVRAPCETDRRINLVLLTSAGHALYAKVDNEAAAFHASMLAQFNHDALCSATGILEELRARLESGL